MTRRGVMAFKRTLQPRQKQTTEEPREHPYRQEETGAAGNPVLPVGTQAAARNHAVQMGVMHQVLPPGMQQSDEADFGAQMLGIGSDCPQGLGRRLKQEVIDHGLVLVGDRGNLFRQRKHYVANTDGNEVCCSAIERLCSDQRRHFGECRWRNC